MRISNTGDEPRLLIRSRHPIVTIETLAEDKASRALGQACAEWRVPMFVCVATANDIMVLAPERVRKGRFDEIFFVDPVKAPYITPTTASSISAVLSGFTRLNDALLRTPFRLTGSS